MEISGRWVLVALALSIVFVASVTSPSDGTAATGRVVEESYTHDGLLYTFSNPRTVREHVAVDVTVRNTGHAERQVVDDPDVVLVHDGGRTPVLRGIKLAAAGFPPMEWGGTLGPRSERSGTVYFPVQVPSVVVAFTPPGGMTFTSRLGEPKGTG